MATSRHFVLGISGASGIILGFKVLQKLLGVSEDIIVHMVMSKSARYTAFEELGRQYAHDQDILDEVAVEHRARVHIYKIHDFGAPIASGTFITEGMAVVPCSMATLAAISTGLSDTLLKRAADVVLKERRRLVLVPREAPLSAIHLQHMAHLASMGTTILPPQPAWYTFPKTIEDVEDHIVGRILDMLGIVTNYRRWTGSH